MKNIVLGLVLLIFSGVSIKAQETDFFELSKQIEIYSSVLKELDMYYIDGINSGELNSIALKAMLKSLDPYTSFYDEQQIEDVNIRRAGEYSGIGASTRYHNKKLYVMAVYEDTPSAKVGLLAGDEIIQIDDVLVSSYEDESVSSLLRGLPDSKVKLKIKRQGKTLDFDIARSKIEMKSVPYWQMLDENVGYIAFIKFNSDASNEVKNAYADLKEKGMTKLVLDLRSNPGGLLKEAIHVTNMFIPKNKTVVTTKAKVKKWSNTYKTNNEPLDLDIPIVVLIDGRSASASEIVAGSLQDYDRAVIMGERSFGKGLVQRYRKLPYGNQMKLTISKYYTPSGRCIQELDYAHREDNGEVPKYSDATVNTFKTANGRIVTDGGGVIPDVKVDKPETLELTKVLYDSEAFFNFITDYVYEHPSIDNPEKFQLDNSTFDDFLVYLKNQPEEFQTSMDKRIEDAVKLSEKEDNNYLIDEDYKAFIKAIHEKKVDLLVQNDVEIKRELTENIVRRYYYRKGEYQHKTIFDPVITQAKDLLNQPNKYNNILK